MAFTDDQKREFIEQVACQCWRDGLVLDVEHNDTREWETLPDVDRELYIEQAEYWIELLRYFELREAVEKAVTELAAQARIDNYPAVAADGYVVRMLKAALKGGEGD